MIFGDMMVFGMMFVTFVYTRRDAQPLFQASQATLNQACGLINTVLMLSSSYCVAMGVQAAKLNRLRWASRMFGAALSCGILFCLVKFFEYAQKVTAGLVINTDEFFMYYYVFTGIHLLHVFVGIGVLIFLIRHSSTERITAPKIGHLESGASFWHLVDLLWIALFALLYLLK